MSPINPTLSAPIYTIDERLWLYPPKKPWYRRHPPPTAIIAVSLLEASFFCLDQNNTLFERLAFVPSRRSEPWRLLSYMLVHLDPVHLALNVVLQLVLAAPLEVDLGAAPVTAVYLGAGASGALASALAAPHLLLAGASAGVYGLLASHGALLAWRYDTLRHPRTRLAVLATLTLSDAMHSALRQGPVLVAWQAHVAGAVAGLLLGLGLYWRPGAPLYPAVGALFLLIVVWLLAAVAYYLSSS